MASFFGNKWRGWDGERMLMSANKLNYVDYGEKQMDKWCVSCTVMTLGRSAWQPFCGGCSSVPRSTSQKSPLPFDTLFFFFFFFLGVVDDSVTDGVLAQLVCSLSVPHLYALKLKRWFLIRRSLREHQIRLRRSMTRGLRELRQQRKGLARQNSASNAGGGVRGEEAPHRSVPLPYRLA